MSDVQSLVLDSLRKIGSEGLRLKKFRQSIIDALEGSLEITDIKAQFQTVLDDLCEKGQAILADGIVRSGESKKRSREEKPFESAPKPQHDEFESAVIHALSAIPSKGLRLKKFRQGILDNFDNGSNIEEIKKKFSDIFDKLCDDGSASLADGMVTCLKQIDSSRNTQNNNSNVKKYPKIQFDDTDKTISTKELYKDGEKAWRNNLLDDDYLTTNPDKITRLFCGNLKLNITEEQLMNCIDGITHIKWMTDKQTREFYGSTFIEMKNPSAAAAAVRLDKTKLLGRPLKIYYCPPRPGDVWPPQDCRSGSTAPPRATKTIALKPENCRKIFVGNLSYNIDDEVLVEFFKDCGTMVGLRWLTHKDSGDFKGCGFVEFETTEAADRAIAKNGMDLLGRPIRLDWDA